MYDAELTIDWATDFDLLDPSFVADPYPVWDAMREGCPIAHSDRHGGSWLPSTYALVSQIAHDSEHFSSRDVAVTEGVTGNTLLVAPPITSDPPFHTPARRLILPAFSPKAIAVLETRTREIARELLAAIGDDPTTDIATSYAQHIPVRVIALMLGIPPEDEARFTDWAVRVFQVGQAEPEEGRAAIREVLQFFRVELDRRREEPLDDLISYLAGTTLDGAPLTDKHIIGTCFLLLLAGIDTTWSSISASLLHLATHPDDRDRLVREPSLMPTAVEEFLRAYSPVTMARVVTEDVEVAGQRLCAGDKVLLPFPAANRDPAVFEAPDEVRIDREHNRHLAFGTGVHRCAGSNLARMELRVAIEEWLTRFPGFRLADDAHVEWTGGQVRGPRAVPVVLR